MAFEAPFNGSLPQTKTYRAPEARMYIDMCDIKERKEIGLDFLPCVCGTKPFLMESPYMNGFAVVCPKCRISTDFIKYIDFARETWNAHCIHGINNADRVESGREADMRRTSYRFRNNLTESVNSLQREEYFYEYDQRYMKKIRSMLRRGDLYLSYKDLCCYLNEKVEIDEPSRKRHIAWWKRFFAYSTMARKMIIIKVFDEPAPYSGNKDDPNARRQYKFYRPQPFITPLKDSEKRRLETREKYRAKTHGDLKYLIEREIEEYDEKQRQIEEEHLKAIGFEVYSEDSDVDYSKYVGDLQDREERMYNESIKKINEALSKR